MFQTREEHQFIYDCVAVNLQRLGHSGVLAVEGARLSSGHVWRARSLPSDTIYLHCDMGVPMAAATVLHLLRSLYVGLPAVEH